MVIEQVSVFLENKSGRLTEVTEVLFENHINITALSVAETSDYGVARIIVSDPAAAITALKARGFSVSLTKVLCVLVPNQPGALCRALRILSDAKISIEYLYVFAMGNNAPAVLRTEDIEGAIKVLTDHKMELIHASELYSF